MPISHVWPTVVKGVRPGLRESGAAYHKVQRSAPPVSSVSRYLNKPCGVNCAEHLLPLGSGSQLPAQGHHCRFSPNCKIRKGISFCILNFVSSKLGLQLLSLLIGRLKDRRRAKFQFGRGKKKKTLQSGTFKHSSLKLILFKA